MHLRGLLRRVMMELQIVLARLRSGTVLGGRGNGRHGSPFASAGEGPDEMAHSGSGISTGSRC